MEARPLDLKSFRLFLTDAISDHSKCFDVSQARGDHMDAEFHRGIVRGLQMVLKAVEVRTCQE